MTETKAAANRRPDHRPGPSAGKPARLLLVAATAHGFRVFQDDQGWQLWHEPAKKVLFIHDADTPGEKCVTSRAVKNLRAHRDELRQWIVQ